MRFIILTQYFAPEVGAPQVRLASMARALLKAGHEVEIVTAMPSHPVGSIFPEYRGRLYALENWEGIKLHRVWVYASVGTGIKRILNYLSFTVTSIFALWRCQRPSYIFVESPPLFLSISAVLAFAFARVPIIFNVADLWPDSVRELGIIKNLLILRVAEMLEHWSYKKADFVVAVTEGIRDVLIQKKQVARDKVLFLPNGVDLAIFKPKKPGSMLAQEINLVKKKIILYAGTVGAAQGCETAILAMAKVIQQVPEAQLVFVGGGSDWKKLQQLVKSSNLKGVVFLDPIPPEKISDLYSISYMGLALLKNLPIFEGARPSKVFPIMACAKPVVYSGSGEGARLVQAAQAGIVVPPENSEMLAEAIIQILENPIMANQFGTNGLQYVTNHLSWDMLIHDWLEQLKLAEERDGNNKSIRK